MERIDERKATLFDVLYVLENGYREEAKDSYDEAFKTWKYSIRGKIEGDIELRIIIKINEESIVIITVVNLDLKEEWL